LRAQLFLNESGSGSSQRYLPSRKRKLQGRISKKGLYIWKSGLFKADIRVIFIFYGKDVLSFPGILLGRDY